MDYQLVTNALWVDGTPDSTVELASTVTQRIVSADVIQTVTNQPINGGIIKYVCCWYPLTPDSSVVAA